MLFKEIKRIGGLLLIFLVFARFSCGYPEEETQLTVLSITVTDEQTNIPVTDALVGVYSGNFCLMDTILTDIDGKAEYAFMATGIEGWSNVQLVKTIPRLTNASNSSDIKAGRKNDISLQVRYLHPVFDIIIATSYDSILLKSMDREFSSLDESALLYCENIYDVKTNNDQLLLTNNAENINFTFKGVFNKINYLYIEKYLGNTAVFDTVELLLTDEVESVLIE